MGSKIESLLNNRAHHYRKEALRRALTTLQNLRESGVEAGIVGSLARSTFKAHSDVDFFILNHPCSTIDEVLTIIEHAMGDFPFDVIFRETVNTTDLSELLEELIYASDLRQIALSS